MTKKTDGSLASIRELESGGPRWVAGKQDLLQKDLTMTTSFRSLLTVTTALLLGLGGPAVAADPAPTTLTIPSMDCPNCAKKVAAKLSEVPGVAKVETDPDTGTVKVTPQPKAVLSPKALWEAAEKAKYKPTKLQGPGGTFEAKPKA